MKQAIRCFIAILFGFTGLFPAFAQSGNAQSVIPQELLDLDFKTCMQGCPKEYGDKVCKPLCLCTVRHFKEKLTLSSYLDLRVELSQNQVSAKSRAFLDSVAKACTTEVEKSGAFDAPKAAGKTPSRP